MATLPAGVCSNRAGWQIHSHVLQPLPGESAPASARLSSAYLSIVSLNVIFGLPLTQEVRGIPKEEYFTPRVCAMGPWSYIGCAVQIGRASGLGWGFPEREPVMSMLREIDGLFSSRHFDRGDGYAASHRVVRELKATGLLSEGVVE